MAASVASVDEYVDAFPAKVFQATEIAELRQVLEEVKTAKTISVHKTEAVPVIPLKMECEDEEDDNRCSSKIAYFNLIQDRHMLGEQFERLFGDASERLLVTGHEDVDWNHVDKRMLKLPRLGHRQFNKSKINKTDGQCRRKNTDNRQSFVYKQMRLDKGSLTNGVRSTAPDEYHVYAVYSVPIMMYRMKNCINTKPPSDRTFYPHLKNQFDAFLLERLLNVTHTLYAVPPNHKYLTVTLQKTCYALFRVSTSAYALIGDVDVYDAFCASLAFRPKTPEEIERLLSTNDPVPKRKRGRPLKSLDKITWTDEEKKEKDSPAVFYVLDPIPQQQSGSRSGPVEESVNESEKLLPFSKRDFHYSPITEPVSETSEAVISWLNNSKT